MPADIADTAPSDAMLPAVARKSTVEARPPPTPAGAPDVTPPSELAELAVAGGGGRVSFVNCSTRFIASCCTETPFCRARFKLCEAIEVPRIGAQPPAMFQLPS